jgi:peptidoglycan/xylan/chitin deacetylase (PgdA/CDA1 family)
VIGRAISELSIGISRVLHAIHWTPNLRSRSDLRIVLYHGIGDGTSPCMSSLKDEVPLDVFEEQLRWLESRYRLVALDAALSTSGDGPDGQRARACLTFDDGLRSLYDSLRPSLAARGIPAAVFLNTAAVGNRTLLWQHALSYLMHHHGVSDVYKRLSHYAAWTGPSPSTGLGVIQVCQHNFSDVWRSNAISRLIGDFQIDIEGVARRERPYLDRDQIATMAQAGFSFYSHTSSHLPLAHVDEAVMKEEVDRARQDLSSLPGTSERFISFPFGMWRDFGGDAHHHALDNGYTVLHVEDGWNPVWRVRRSKTLRRTSLGEGRDAVHFYATVEVCSPLKGMLSVERDFRSHSRRTTGG